MPEPAVRAPHKLCQCFTPDEIRILNPTLWFNSPRDWKRDLPLSWTRDVELSLHVFGALAPYGYRLGDVIRNKPPRHPPGPGDPPVAIATPLGAQNMVCGGTRWALDDEVAKRRAKDEPRVVKPLPRGHTSTERDIYRTARPFFSWLSRDEMTIADFLRSQLAPGYEHFASIQFYMQRWAAIKALGRSGFKGEPKRIHTVGVVMRVEHMRPGGPGLLCVFGMDGSSGVAFSYAIAKRHPEWLLEPGLRLVELVGEPVPDHATDLEFALDWRMTTFLHYPIPDAATQPVLAHGPVSGHRHQTA